MKLSKDQMAALADKLSNPWGSVGLMCDGYLIDLQVQRVKGMTYRVMTFVNGQFKGSWCSPDKKYPEQKFLRKCERSVVSAAKRAQAEKEFGKRYVARNSFYQAKITYFMPDFASGKAAISHLCKVCDSIEVLE